MCKSIHTNEKQVVYYNFNKPVDRSFLLEAIKKIEEYGLRVRSCVFDGGNHTLIGVKLILFSYN